jgi:hypothetical protein
MKRRIVIISTLVGIVGTGAGFGAAFADAKDHQVCVVFASNQNWHNTQAFCVDTGNIH